MTGGDASLHSVGERPFDDGIEQKMAGVEVLVDMHVERQPASLRELEQEIEKGERLIGILRNAADDIRSGADRSVEPAATSIELPRRVARQMCDNLQGQPVAATLRNSISASTPRMSLSVSMLVWLRIATVPRATQASSVRSARAMISSRVAVAASAR